jgi:hypothetical protein
MKCGWLNIIGTAHWETGYITAKPESSNHVNKMLKTVIAIFFVLTSALSYGDGSSLDGALDAIADEASRDSIRKGFQEDDAILIIYGKSYLYISVNKFGESNYISSKIGRFKGEFNSSFKVEFKKLVSEMRKIVLTNADDNLMKSVKDGASFYISNNGKTIYLADPIIIYFDQDDNAPNELSLLTDLVIRAIFTMSKFDSVAQGYFELSLTRFDANVELSEFDKRLKTERDNHKKYNKFLNGDNHKGTDKLSPPRDKPPLEDEGK